MSAFPHGAGDPRPIDQGPVKVRSCQLARRFLPSWRKPRGVWPSLTSSPSQGGRGRRGALMGKPALRFSRLPGPLGAFESASD
ncbi:MAG: hypothetical protein B6A08_10785 [Sorangiineae bacterium NIC37A_2]|nr:MAG: hypothetical protein B6A08_10785 [Sorangiineae bacterium NIC37A_2]